MKYLLMLSLLLLSWGGHSSVFAQQTGQQQQQMQKQMQKMMENMNGLMERTQTMNQEMNRRMQEAQNEEMRNQYQMMHRFNEQMQLTLGTMKNAAERCDMMQKDQTMMRDRDMQRDMDRLRQNLQDMTSQADEAVQTMERLTKRLGQQAKASN